MKTPYKNQIYYEDLKYIMSQLSMEERGKLNRSTILVTGCAGFLGFYLLSFFHEYKDELGIQKVTAIDNFRLGKPDWIHHLDPNLFEFMDLDITKMQDSDLERIGEVDFIVHMASIASPTYYRLYPIETVDANVWGLRRLLDWSRDAHVKGFLFFSSSEIYGDPAPDQIPTPESYSGNVQTIGPRACYDEAKRFGETLCYLYAQRYGMPIAVVRPFNNYGPGMRLTDTRVPADFAKAVLRNEPIRMFSDGRPTRTFCYIADAWVGYLKAMLHGRFDVFNIGIDRPEISVSSLAEIYREAAAELFGQHVPIEYAVSEDKSYLTHNPSRRCPDLTKARSLLQYEPSVDVKEGVRRYLLFLKQGGAPE
ncbi:NAD-dependent epimerase/dehydratase family protein [Paenibacillus sp.]|uniref:NAD-dependent epimerase/dehydratase family protein n=1 Tax=Paenibacillus sp. TaxID=58172 RepID=UPI002D3B542A|nr:NAD-dependent epimerase/dehydratase family protein [Paenibacillus sp.]HZG87973.1 NAD-dependent epimerase/dehydratase family protein [Paenibacillus sp.]